LSTTMNKNTKECDFTLGRHISVQWDTGVIINGQHV